MKIAIGADHRGSASAAQLRDRLTMEGHEIETITAAEGESVDYPVPAFEVGRRVAEGRADFGVLICGTGIGVSIAANKVPGVRAALVRDELSAQLSRSHNNANVICMAADMIADHRIDTIVNRFLETGFEGGRHARRVGKIAAIERGESPAEASGDEPEGQAGDSTTFFNAPTPAG